MADREKVKKGLDLCLTGEVACKDCPYDAECKEARGIGPSPLRRDALELLKHDEQTIVSLQSTINKLTKAFAGKLEQKHGHWFYDPDGMDWGLPAWRCSECRCRSDNIPPNLERTNPLLWSGSKYCPNCGAKMDEEVKQDDRT